MTGISCVNTNLALNENSSQAQKSLSKYVSEDSSVPTGSSASSVYIFLVNALKPMEIEGVSKSDLTEQLKTLLADDSEEADNSDEISNLTNIIADFDKLSAGGGFITESSLASSDGYEI